eukprot:GILI01005950.1.p1 GENE.GILI01005950.1~~GILI01005950.1.p1  ORF type:complete len:407 (+),score=85.95 GILI01005950.1:101-1222(+)
MESLGSSDEHLIPILPNFKLKTLSDHLDSLLPLPFAKSKKSPPPALQGSASLSYASAVIAGDSPLSLPQSLPCFSATASSASSPSVTTYPTQSLSMPAPRRSPPAIDFSQFSKSGTVSPRKMGYPSMKGEPASIPNWLPSYPHESSRTASPLSKVPSVPQYASLQTPNSAAMASSSSYYPFATSTAPYSMTTDPSQASKASMNKKQILPNNGASHISHSESEVLSAIASLNAVSSLGPSASFSKAYTPTVTSSMAPMKTYSSISKPQPPPQSRVSAPVVSSSMISAESASSVKKAYICPFPNCGKAFSAPCRLRDHEFSHTKEKRFTCNFPGCGKSFSLASNYKRHLRLHAKHAQQKEPSNESSSPEPESPVA